MKHLLAALLMVALTGTLSDVLAQPGKHWKPEGERFREGRKALAEKLDLTESQQSQFQKLRLEHEKKMLQGRNKVQEARLDLKALYLAEKPDRSAIEKTLKSISDLQHQQKMAMVDHWFMVHSMLTPEQQKIWKNHAGMMGQGFGDDGPGGKRIRRHLR